MKCPLLLVQIKDYHNDVSFSVKFHGYASGPHRKESDVQGRELEVNLTATTKPIIGSFGFGELTYKIKGAPRDYD